MSDSCQNCGRLILNNEAVGYDDIASSPYVTDAGELFCIPCGRAQDESEREAYAEDHDHWPCGAWEGEP